MKKFLILALSAVIALASCTKEANLDGKWNAPRHEDQPDDIALSLIFKGNNLDLYICSYGWHFEGTYSYADGVIKYNITKGYAALTHVGRDEHGMIVEYSGGIESINHQTLEPNPEYGWYNMTEYRPDLYEEYTDMLSSFTFEIGSDGKARSNILGIGGTFTKVK